MTLQDPARRAAFVYGQPMAPCPVRRPRVQTMVREAHEFQGRYKGFDLDLMRDGPFSRWYIRVRDPRGCYAYDGWWQESAGKSLDDAITEALKGACLWTPNSK